MWVWLKLKTKIDKDQELTWANWPKEFNSWTVHWVVASNGVPNHKKTTIGESQPENCWIFIRKIHCNIFQVQAWSHPTRSEECHGFESQQLCEPGTFYQSSWFRSTIRKERCEFFGKKLRKFLPAKKNILSIYIFNLHVFNMCCSWKRVKPRTFSSSKSQDSDFAFEPRPRDFFAKHGEETEAFRTPRWIETSRNGSSKDSNLRGSSSEWCLHALEWTPTICSLHL